MNNVPASVPTESELWFDRYVAEHGQDPGSPEPDLGGSRRPDRRIIWKGEAVVCEVKEFGADVVKSKGRVQAIGATKWYRPVREKVHGGAREESSTVPTEDGNTSPSGSSTRSQRASSSLAIPFESGTLRRPYFDFGGARVPR